MKDMKEIWAERTAEALRSMAEEKGVPWDSRKAHTIVLQKPPKPEMGDIAVPMFPFAKEFRTAPQRIAAEAAEKLNMRYASEGSAETAGPYLNITINTDDLAETVIREISEQGEAFGAGELYKDKKIMIEFSCPNTNKPLHLGHLRNDAIGESVAAICAANGAEVRKVNLINDRGVHICKSMLAYERFGNGSSPESEEKKSDHFVGDYYVKFSQWAKDHPEAEQEAQKMLQKWESGDPHVTELWKKMNAWTIEGIEETYRKTGISFDAVYYESRTYSLGREEVLKGLEQGIFYKDEEGTVWADLSEIGLDRKVLLRRDGTSLYLTQDIGTAITRHRDWPFQEMIYVVGSEQKYHFQVLFHILQKLGFPWAHDLHHLSYGMVNLPEGRMKSREGTVVDADDLIEELQRMAVQEIREKDREDAVGAVEAAAESVALAALNYFLLQVNPNRDMIFNPKESLSFNGNTGPYLQYMGARISSMLRKYDAKREKTAGPEPETEIDASVLQLTEERELVKLLSSYPERVRQAGEELNPSVIAVYVYDLAKLFSRYYHDVPIMKADNPETAAARVALSRSILQVMKNAFRLIGIPFLEIM